MKKFCWMLLVVFVSCHRGPANQHMAKGRELYMKRDFANAEYELTQGLGGASDFEARFLRGKCYFFSRRFPEAEAEFLILHKRDPGHVGALLWWARSSLAVGKPGSMVEEDLRKVLAKDDENVGAYQVLGAILEMKGDFVGALACYQKSLVYEGELASTHGRLDRLRGKMGLLPMKPGPRGQP